MGCSTYAGSQLTIPQALQLAADAGFSGQSQIIMVAVAMSESNLYTHAINSCDPYGGSFGVLQINGSHFGRQFGNAGQYTMSQSAAFDPALSFIFSFELSAGGTDFTPWGSYTNGGYLNHISAVRAALGQSAGTGTQFPPYTGTPWYSYDYYSDAPAGQAGYHNTDVGTPVDTPITAPLAGTVTDIGYFDWGGQVTWKVDTPSAINGHKDAFVIHLDAINPNLQVGQHINKGDFLGYSGGQNTNAGLPPTAPGGLQHHITLPSHSTGPHLDIGVSDSSTGSLDIDQWASNQLVLMARSQQIPYGPSGTFTPDLGNPNPTGNEEWFNKDSLGQKIHNTLVQYPGFYGIADALDEANTFPGFINDMPVIDKLSFNDLKEIGEIPGAFLQSITDTIIGNSIPLFVRGVLIVAGLFLLLALLWQLAKPQIESLQELAPLLLAA